MVSITYVSDSQIPVHFLKTYQSNEDVFVDGERKKDGEKAQRKDKISKVHS
jgi:hypothetical protein